MRRKFSHLLTSYLNSNVVSINGIYFYLIESSVYEGNKWRNFINGGARDKKKIKDMILLNEKGKEFMDKQK